jgi:hypothetical protein
VAGTALFAACSLAGGLAANASMLVGARLGQGADTAMMVPASCRPDYPDWHTPCPAKLTRTERIHVQSPQNAAICTPGRWVGCAQLTGE